MGDVEDLTRRWALGWAVCRRMPVVERPDGVLEVDVRDPVAAGVEDRRRVELVVAAPSPELLAGLATEVAAAPGTWLSVMTSSPHDPATYDGLTVLARAEALMHCSLAPGGPTTDPRVVLEVDGDRAFVTVRVGDDGDVVAARGCVAVVGADAVVDRIETHVAHRRQGLGRLVMQTLTSWAADRGAGEGLLVASVDGQQLYRSLGWRVTGHFTTSR